MFDPLKFLFTFSVLAICPTIAFRSASTFKSKIVVDVTRSFHAQYLMLNSTILVNSSFVAKNLPKCNGNFWTDDDYGWTYKCDSNKTLVVSYLPTSCLEFSKTPNALGVYECISCPWAIKENEWLSFYYEIVNNVAQLQIVGGFAKLNIAPLVNIAKAPSFKPGVNASAVSFLTLPHTIEKKVGNKT